MKNLVANMQCFFLHFQHSCTHHQCLGADQHVCDDEENTNLAVASPCSFPETLADESLVVKILYFLKNLEALFMD